MKRSSGISSDGSVFEEDGCGLLAHDLLLLGDDAIQSLLGLSDWLSADRAWTCDLEVGVLRGEVLLDETLVCVNVSSLAGREEYCGMLDSRLSACDGVVYLVHEKFDKEQVDSLFEQISQAKDGRMFSMALALIGADEKSALFLKASEWADEHYGVTVSCMKTEDHASLAQCICDVAVLVHRSKASLARILAAQSTASSPISSSRHSGSIRSSRRGSSSSIMSCAGLRWGRRKSSATSASFSTTSSINSRISKEEKSSYRQSTVSNGSQCSIM